SSSGAEWEARYAAGSVAYCQAAEVRSAAPNAPTNGSTTRPSKRASLQAIANPDAPPPGCKREPAEQPEAERDKYPGKEAAETRHRFEPSVREPENEQPEPQRDQTQERRARELERYGGCVVNDVVLHHWLADSSRSSSSTIAGRPAPPCRSCGCSIHDSVIAPDSGAGIANPVKSSRGSHKKSSLSSKSLTTRVGRPQSTRAIWMPCAAKCSRNGCV